MIKFEGKEIEANDHLMAYMDIIRGWSLNCNSDELGTAIHTLQLFVIKHVTTFGCRRF